MNQHDRGRGRFLRHSALAIGVVAVPLEVIGASALPPCKRDEWHIFKSGTHYGALVNAIKTMKANTNVNDPASWTYWVHIHVTRCTHGVPYFLGWHRGYLHHVEKRLRLVSGDSGLTLPYWDCHANANLPSEFTDPGPGNPLYANRVNTNLKPALSMNAFSGSLVNFQTGTSKAFEPSVETAPHLLAPPAVGTFRLSQARTTGESTFPTAGALQVALGEPSLSVQLPSSSDHRQAIARIARGNAAPIRARVLKYKFFRVVLDDIVITAEGSNSGYFYNVFLNVPAGRSSSSAPRISLIGTLGPFQVRAAAYQSGGPAKLRYVVTQLLAGIPIVDIGMATVSFIRVNKERSPAGSVIEISEVRIELSTDGDES